ncbi:uncharacterized protein LOC109715431 [Ananas comosus]|uniref:Uncharacterized protein LOC109715431 n=1 Tax=Ananas comosus TaxID=4615 RepID=A0A6P5FJ93_ANACO|nr:uncharacterized protein LOC109715431 [Ananas comosus]
MQTAPPETVTVAPTTAPDVFAVMREVSKAEQERIRMRLVEYRRFDPPHFCESSTEPGTVEAWVKGMERLFEDLFIPERDQIYLAVHCLEGDARDWWTRARRSRPKDAPPVTWTEFRGMLFDMYFPSSVKERMEDELKKLRQGSHSVQEYFQEFSRLLTCVPFVARNDRHRADMFEKGLSPELYKLVQIQHLSTLEASVEMAMRAERGEVVLRERAEMEQSSDRKRSTESEAGPSSSGRPPRYPRSRFQGRGSFAGRRPGSIRSPGGARQQR